MRAPGRAVALVCGLVLAAQCHTGPRTAGRSLDLLQELPFARVRVDTGPDPTTLNRRQLRQAGLVRRHTREGWLGVGGGSRLHFRVVTMRSRRLHLEGSALAAYRRAGGAVEVRVNDRPIQTLHLRRRAQPYEIELPGAVLHPGDNVLELRYIAVQGDTAPRPRVQWTHIGFEEMSVRTPRIAGSVLRLPFGAALEFAARVLPGARIRLGAVRGAATVGARLRIQVRSAGGGEQVVEVPLGGSTEIPLEVSGIVRVGLAPVRDSYGKIGPAGDVEITAAQILGVVPALPWPSPPSPPARFEGANVLVYLIDTLRADHLGVYGYDRPTSPNIDAFAADAVRFARVQAQSSWTKPSVASVLTGRLPQQHGAVGRADPLPLVIPTLGSLLQIAGYDTYAISTNSTVSFDFDFDRGFYEYVQLGERRTPEVHQLSDVVNQRVFEWLERRDSAHPFFAWLHTTDPHEPYEPRQPYRDRFAPRLLRPDIDKGPAAWRALEADPKLDPERIAADLRSLYDGEIAFNDEQFGRLMAELRRRHLYDSTLIVLLSDHGEEFYDHGGWSHGATLYQEQLRVPLLIKLPHQQYAGLTVQDRVQHIDLLPTVLDSLNLPVPVGLPGHSLLPLMAGGAAPERVILSHLVAPYDLLESARWVDTKLIRTRDREGDVHLQRFDLSVDSHEQSPRLDDEDIVASYLSSVIAHARAAAVAGSGRIEDLAPDVAERLRALGYIQ